MMSRHGILALAVLVVSLAAIPVAMVEAPAVVVGWVVLGALASMALLRAARAARRAAATPHASTAATVGAALADLDRVEYRSVELGTPWPQLTVGPTGVLIVDVCPGRPARPGRRAPRAVEGRLARTSATQHLVRQALADAGVELPVRAVAVFALEHGPPVLRRSPDQLALIPASELPTTLATGPVVAMPVVDAAFTSLTRRSDLATAS